MIEYSLESEIMAMNKYATEFRIMHDMNRDDHRVLIAQVTRAFAEKAMVQKSGGGRVAGGIRTVLITFFAPSDEEALKVSQFASDDALRPFACDATTLRINSEGGRNRLRL